MGLVNYRRRPLVFDSIGKPINDLSLEEAIKVSGLDFNVGITECRARLRNPNDPDKYLLYQIPGANATYRTDTNKVFGVVGSKYEVVQNSTALDFIEQVCNYDKSVRIETAGCYGDGRSMLVTAKFPESLTIGTNDNIDRYLLFTNSHDGSGSITCAVTNIRVICNNMLNQAIRQASQLYQFKHTKNVKNAIMTAVENIRGAYAYSEIMEEQMEELRHIKVGPTAINTYVYKLFLNAEQQEHMKLKPNIHAADTDVVSTKTINKVASVLDTIESGVGQELHRGSCLWLYNGVTCYLNNVANYKSEEERYESLTKKGASKLNQRAYDLALTRLSA